MNTVFVIKRDVDCNGKPLNEYQPVCQDAFWGGKNGGYWTGWGASIYATRKHAEAAMKRNAKSEWTFKRGYAYIAEVELATVR